MSTGYYLLDHPNPNAPAYDDGCYWGKPTIDEPPRVIVVHTTEGWADIIEPDMGAENVAQWFATNDVEASYHTLVDSDSTVRCLPAGLDGTTAHKAWHCYGYNWCSLGVSFATRAAQWPTLPADWIEAALDRAADEVAAWCRRWSIPAEQITKADVDAGRSGITSHGALNPGDRTDPGADFPWITFLAKVQARLDPTPQPQPDPPPYDEGEETMRACRMNDGQVLLVDGSTFQVMSGDWPQINAALIELGRAGLIPVDAAGAPVITAIGDNAVNALRQVS